MSALPLILTTDGRDALINAQNTGVSNVVISQIGLAPAQVALSAATTAIPGETKRLNLVGGTVVAPETFYVSGTDTSADTYTVRTVALYLSNGVLLGGYSQAAVLLEKAEPAMAVIEASIRLAEPLATSIEFTGGGWNNPPASETVEGIVRLATQLEVNAGTNDKRPVTPKTLKGLLDVLLAGFATAGHTHDASATTTGTFNEARIPDLGLGRITGLVAALAGKAAAAHTHAMADITGLVDALAGKAAAAHTHAMADITGLVAALAGKAASVHSHVMADITGLTAALALKADLAGAIFTGVIQGPELRATGAGVGRAVLIKGTVDNLGYVSFQDPAGTELGYVGWRTELPSGPHSQIGGPRPWAFSQRPRFNGAIPWDADNFNPADKANALHSHDWAQITGKPDVAINGQSASHTTLSLTAGAGQYALNVKGDFSALIERSGQHGITVYPKSGGRNAIYSDYFSGGAALPLALGAFPNQTALVLDTTGFAGVGVTNPQGRLHVVGGVGQTLILDRTGSPVARRFQMFVGDGTGGTISDEIYIRSVNTDLHFMGGGSGTTEFMRLTYTGQLMVMSRPTFNGNTAWDDGNARSTAANFRSNGDNQALTPNVVWSAAQLVAAAQAATIAVDLSTGLNFSTTMTGNRTLGAPSNAKPGQSGVINITQDGTGNRTLAFNAAWKFAGGTAPVLSTAANARDVLVFTVIAANEVVASLLKDVR